MKLRTCPPESNGLNRQNIAASAKRQPCLKGPSNDHQYECFKFNHSIDAIVVKFSEFNRLEQHQLKQFKHN
jgi:hypothetical protein